jgi:hypothetical protein
VYYAKDDLVFYNNTPPKLESNSLSLYDEDNVSQHSVDGYHGDINEDTTATKSHHHR